MEKMNRKMPFEHQMMFIIKDYDRKVEEIHELRKELNELSQALEEFGGRGDRASLKIRYNNLKEKNKSLEAKLKKGTESLFEERKSNARLQKRVNILTTTLGICRKQLLQLLALVEVPTLRKVVDCITKTLDGYRKESFDTTTEA